MAGTQSIRAGRAFVEVFLKDSRLRRGLDRAAARLKAFGGMVRNIGTKFLTLGTAALAPLMAAATVFASTGDALDKMSARTAVSVESLSELGFAAEQSGAGLDQLGSALFRMKRRIANAATGGGPAVRALRDLGVEAKAITELPVEAQFEAIVRALEGIENESLRAQYAFEIFGDGAKSLMPMLNAGADGIEALRKEARRLGLTISTEDAQAAAEFTDAMNRLWKVIRRGVFAIGASLAPTLTDLADRINRLVKTAVDWIKANGRVILFAAKLAAVVLGAGAALVALGTSFTVMGMALGGISSALGVLGAVIGALLSPIGLVIAGLVAFTAWFLTSTEAGGAALDWLAGKFFKLRDFALKAFGGISDALAAGDIGLAAKILWLTLQVTWQKGISVLKQQWIEWKAFFLRVFNEAVFNLAGFFTDAWAGMQIAWVESVSFMADAWTVFTSSLTKGWRSAQNFISKGVLKLMALFDDSVDAEAAGKLLDQDMARANRKLEQEVNQTIFSREQQRKTRLGQIEADRQGAQSMLDQGRAAEERKLQSEQEAALAASTDALSQARREWQAAIDEAARKRQDVDTDDDGPSPLKRFMQSLDGIDSELSGAKERNVEVQGTFNALAAVRGLGAGSAADRTAKATEETAKNTKRLLQAAQQGGLAFE